MTLNRSGFDYWREKAPEISFQWREVNLETFLHLSQLEIPQMLLIHLLLTGFASFQTCFSITYRKSPRSSWLPEDLMVHNNSQDENISLLTEVWPCSMSRELSERPYFGTYLQTSMHTVYFDSRSFSPFGKCSITSID